MVMLLFLFYYSGKVSSLVIDLQQIFKVIVILPFAFIQLQLVCQEKC